MSLTDDLAAIILYNLRGDYSDDNGALSEAGEKQISELLAKALADRLEQVGRFKLGDFVEADSEYGQDWEPVYRLRHA